MRAAVGMALILLMRNLPASAQDVAERSSDSIVLTVSKETTFLLEPRDAEGWIDYARALESELSQGVTPENNAAVLWWQALGPDEIRQDEREAFFRCLGIASPPIVGEYFVNLGEFTLVPPAGVNADDWRTRLNDQLSQAVQRPWTANEFPEIAQWVEMNEAPLTLIAAAVQRPHCHSPLLASAPSTRLSGVLLPHVQESRSMGQALLSRAMLRLAEGRIDDAWSDVMFAHLLARMVARGPWLVELLVGSAIESMACVADAALLREGQLSAAQAQTFLADLSSLSLLPETARVVDRTERYTVLDDYSRIIRSRNAGLVFELTESPPVQQAFSRMLDNPSACDWDEPLRVCNQWCDRIVQGMRIESRRERRRELDQLSDELRQISAQSTNPQRLEQELSAASPKGRGEIIGNLMAGALLPRLVQGREAEDRVTTRIRVSRLGMALASHVAEHGRFPASLDELKPSPADGSRTDPFTDAPFVYKADENGCVLYSLGSNEHDDGGRTYDEGDRTDDLVVRIRAVHND